MADFEDGNTSAAKDQLLRLAVRYPRSKPVLLALLEVSHKMKDWRIFAFYSEQLLPLERGDDRADTLNNLVFAHTQLFYPALARHFAQELMKQHPGSDLVEQIRSFVKETEPFLLQEAEEWEEMADLTLEDKFDIMLQHDRVRFYTESGHAREAIPIAESLLSRLPNLVAILNNLSLAQFMIREVTQAVATAQKVLGLSPENVHALSNLVRFTFLTGQFDEAQQYVERLTQTTSDNPDWLTKQAEAFAFLGDDARVQAAYEQAKKTKANFPLNPLLLHLAAAAYFRQGNEKTAWRLWRQAVKQAPSFDMARESLADKRLPVGKRDVPWHWSFHYWALDDLHKTLDKLFSKGGPRASTSAVKQAMFTYLKKRPYLPKLFPHMLERGDRATREFALNFIRVVDTPELMQILYDFALGRYGADDIRMEALQFISQHHPHMLPENKQLPMWIKGKQSEIMMMGFEITGEPQPAPGIPEEILDKYETAHDLMLNEEAEAAGQLLREIIAAAPDFHAAYNLLTVAYGQQGRKDDARALAEETYARFPDYLFGRTALAQMLAQEKQVEEAKDLLDPLMRRTKLHISEFRALAFAQMEIALADGAAEGALEAARGWLSMWRQMEGDHPALAEWDRRINGPAQLLRGFQKLLGRRR